MARTLRTISFEVGIGLLGLLSNDDWHSCFRVTMDGTFFGIGDEVTKKLADARKTAREKQMKENRAARCSMCVGETESGALLLQRARSRLP